MPTLLDIQRAFKDTVLGAGSIADDGHALAGHILENGIPAPERLQIYRNNTMILLADTLSETFPVVRKLVGDDFFHALATAFIRAHPPHTPSLIGYGDGFAGFIEGFEAARPLPYLSDVSRLEWAWNESYHAADANPLDPAALETVPSERLGDIAFRLHPSARFLSSTFPVVAIWDANQDGAENEATISLDDGPVHALVIRPAIDVEVRTVSKATSVFLYGLSLGMTVTDAHEKAAREDPAFDLGQTLGLCLADGTMTHAFLDGRPLSSPLLTKRGNHDQ